MDAKLAEYNRAVGEINRRGKKLMEAKELYEILKAENERYLKALKQIVGMWVANDGCQAIRTLAQAALAPAQEDG